MTDFSPRIVSGSSGPPVRLCPFPPQLPPPISSRLDISFGFEMWFNVWVLVGSPIPGMSALTPVDLSCAPLDAAVPSADVFAQGHPAEPRPMETAFSGASIPAAVPSADVSR